MYGLGFGLMRLPVIEGKNDNIDLATTEKMVDYFIANGGKYFDTAYPYHGGKSEEAFRELVSKRYPRESYVIADKMPLFNLHSNNMAVKIFDEQLSRCGIDYFDYYLLHCIDKNNNKNAIESDVFNFLLQKKKDGYISKLGFSFHDSPEFLEDFLQFHPEMEFVQLQINYMDWDDASIRAKECYDIARKRGLDVIVMEPVKGGSLVNIPEGAAKIFNEAAPDKSIASWALRFANSLDGVIAVLSGMSSLEQVVDNVEIFSNYTTLSMEEKNVLDKVIDHIRNYNTIPCTACNYCVSDCPMNIPIPTIFSLANESLKYKLKKGALSWRYNTATDNKGKVIDCIKCFACSKMCPQHIDIPKMLKESADIILKE